MSFSWNIAPVNIKGLSEQAAFIILNTIMAAVHLLGDVGWEDGGVQTDLELKAYAM